MGPGSLWSPCLTWAVPYPGGSRFSLSLTPLPPEPTGAVGVAFMGRVWRRDFSAPSAARGAVSPTLRHRYAPPPSVRHRHVLVGVPARPGRGRPRPVGELRAGKRRAGLRPSEGERSRLGRALGWAPSSWGWVGRNNLPPGAPLPGAGLSLGRGYSQQGAGRGGELRGRLEQMPENVVR